MRWLFSNQKQIGQTRKEVETAIIEMELGKVASWFFFCNLVTFPFKRLETTNNNNKSNLCFSTLPYHT